MNLALSLTVPHLGPVFPAEFTIWTPAASNAFVALSKPHPGHLYECDDICGLSSVFGFLSSKSVGASNHCKHLWTVAVVVRWQWIHFACGATPIFLFVFLPPTADPFWN